MIDSHIWFILMPSEAELDEEKNKTQISQTESTRTKLTVCRLKLISTDKSGGKKVRNCSVNVSLQRKEELMKGR